ncbi:MAG: glycosyltransferase [Chthoniobacterales bacterium]
MKRKKIVVMGFMASCPIAGVVWQHLHYIAGLQRLGHDVTYIEDSARVPYDPASGELVWNADYATNVLQKLAREFGFEKRWAYSARYLDDQPTFGFTRKKVRQLYRDADAILNVCGAQELHDDLLVSQRLLYIESDPGVEQVKVDQSNKGTLEYLQRHHALFTFGENVGSKEFPVPTHGLRWLPTRQPVVTDFWKTSRAPAAEAVFTSVANWNTSGLKDIEWRGEKYHWSKSAEFLRFVAAPERARETFELASDIKPPATAQKFIKHGWRLRDPHRLSLGHRRYLAYVRASKGEFTVAKDQYVRLNTGWFSDRSACYLAAGRPVITQETGFSQHYGGAGGLFGFRSLGDIAEAVHAINVDYKQHCRAARDLAREVFEAEAVLRSLLERANV